MAKKLCELCQKTHATDMRFGVSLCQECMDHYSLAMKGDENSIKLFSNPQNFPDATNTAKTNIIDRITKTPAKQEKTETTNVSHSTVQVDKKEIEEQKSFNLDETLYGNIGSKIKGLAKVLCIIEIVAAIISGGAMISEGMEPVGLLLIIVGPIFAWISSWFIYGFGELIDKACDIARNTSDK